MTNSIGGKLNQLLVQTQEIQQISATSFANTLPVVFRAPVLLNLVWLLWGINVSVFRRFNINYGDLLGFTLNGQKSIPLPVPVNKGKALLSGAQIIQSSLYIYAVMVVFYGLHYFTTDDDDNNLNEIGVDKQNVETLQGDELMKLSTNGNGIIGKEMLKNFKDAEDDDDYSFRSQSHILFAVCMYVFFLVMVFMPFNILHKSGRYKLIYNLYKVCVPSKPGVAFVEVLLGDILTSISKIFGDIVIVFFIFYANYQDVSYAHPMHGIQGKNSVNSSEKLNPLSVIKVPKDGLNLKGSQELGSKDLKLKGNDYFNTELLKQTGMYKYIMLLRPVMISIPFVLRFRQCYFQYTIDSKGGKKLKQGVENAYGIGVQRRKAKQAYKHLLNCLKYLSALPVIWLSAYLQLYDYSADMQNLSNSVSNANANMVPNDQSDLLFGYLPNWMLLNYKTLQHFWILSVSFNSFYSFMWDIIMDWGLLQEDSRHFLLRDNLIFANLDLSFNNTLNKLNSLGNLSALGALSGSMNQSFVHVVQQISPRLSKLKQRVSPNIEPAHNPSNCHNGACNLTPISERSRNSCDDANDEVDEINDLLNDKNLENQGSFAEGTEEENDKTKANKNDSCKRICFVWGPALYYAAIAFDFAFRILWSFKLSVHFELSSEGITFVLEICEILRRFVWIFFRVEWESVSTSNNGVKLSESDDEMESFNLSREDSYAKDFEVGHKDIKESVALAKSPRAKFPFGSGFKFSNGLLRKFVPQDGSSNFFLHQDLKSYDSYDKYLLRSRSLDLTKANFH